MKGKEEIEWLGDVAEDGTAYWQGLVLRAECMEGDLWWWEGLKNQKMAFDSYRSY